MRSGIRAKPVVRGTIRENARPAGRVGPAPAENSIKRTVGRSENPRTGPRRREDLIVHEIDREGLIHDPLTADTHRLNETAWIIWNLCDGKHDEEAMVRWITDWYEVGDEAARDHVRRMIAVLDEANLLRDSST